MSERASKFGTLLPLIHSFKFHLKRGDLLFETAKSFLNTQRPVSFLHSGIHSTTIPRHPLCAGHCLLASAHTELTPGERHRKQQQVSCQGSRTPPRELPIVPVPPCTSHPQIGISMHRVRQEQRKQGPSSYQPHDERQVTRNKNICIYKNQAVTNAIKNKSGKGDTRWWRTCCFRFISQRRFLLKQLLCRICSDAA